MRKNTQRRVPKYFSVEVAAAAIARLSHSPVSRAKDLTHASCFRLLAQKANANVQNFFVPLFLFDFKHHNHPSTRHPPPVFFCPSDNTNTNTNTSTSSSYTQQHLPASEPPTTTSPNTLPRSTNIHCEPASLPQTTPPPSIKGSLTFRHPSNKAISLSTDTSALYVSHTPRQRPQTPAASRAATISHTAEAL